MFGYKMHSQALGNGALGRHFSDASDAALETLRDAGDAIARQRDVGMRYARSVADSVRTSSEQAGRSVRHAFEEHPAESLLIIAAVAFAVGWVLGRQPSHGEEAEDARRRPAAARRTRARARSRATE